jgi:hypothetical protein
MPSDGAALYVLDCTGTSSSEKLGEDFSKVHASFDSMVRVCPILAVLTDHWMADVMSALDTGVGVRYRSARNLQ